MLYGTILKQIYNTDQPKLFKSHSWKKELNWLAHLFRPLEQNKNNDSLIVFLHANHFEAKFKN